MEQSMTFEFKFDAPVLALIFKGLSKLPFEESASLIQGLQREVAQQEMKAKRPEIKTELEADKPKRGRPPKESNGIAATNA
jgi:hypothetical protein